MKRVLTGSFLAAAFAVGLSAQTAPPQTTPPTTPPSSPTSAPMQDRESSSKNITVTGCLKAGDSADSFTLSDLKWGGSKGSGAVGTSGAAGAGAAPAALASATTLTIMPSGSTKLAEHVGHQVEISGSVADSKPPSTPADPAAPAARPSASASGPTIEARSVRMVSDKLLGSVSGPTAPNGTRKVTSTKASLTSCRAGFLS